ncbi:C39 family peptidase [Lederbergia citrea]|uniref:C39 family peptidase n=2 Tax=Lederbergia citrea TaxID=2833581 RepID=A0A942UJX5_9BACI|nr:C39 family peptidase [Lederbergia citrea]MBS4175941.1 C39 family peptidase [Lederbergia citrea]MBS4202501.1 C39 family peptidase [Lederbergia citrea]MBS4222831.1 C39 family peptidase [Lederbergia citrea]
MKTLQFITIASAAGVFILLFHKYKRNPIFSAIFSIFAITLFGLAITVYGTRGTGGISPVEKKISHTNSTEQIKNLELIKIKDKVLLNAPVIEQFPELPRGCEVTTLAMLLENAGVKADKMKLAKEIKKDPTPRTIKNGKIHFGNPHKGFVGNMYTFSEPGLGVYHEPIMELAQDYIPGRVINLSGQSFDELKIPLSDGRPIWVIINSQYRKLEDSYFQTWHTDSGKIRITMKEHSVLITGYDKEYVYFNDPLTGIKNKKAPIKDFEQSWVQMGSQALTYSY